LRHMKSTASGSEDTVVTLRTSWSTPWHEKLHNAIRRNGGGIDGASGTGRPEVYNRLRDIWL